MTLPAGSCEYFLSKLTSRFALVASFWALASCIPSSFGTLVLGIGAAVSAGGAEVMATEDGVVSGVVFEAEFVTAHSQPRTRRRRPAKFVARSFPFQPSGAPAEAYTYSEPEPLHQNHSGFVRATRCLPPPGYESSPTQRESDQLAASGGTRWAARPRYAVGRLTDIATSPSQTPVLTSEPAGCCIRCQARLAV